MTKRNLSLSQRKEENRESHLIEPPIKFELSQIKSHFEESLESIKNQYDVAEGLKENNKIEDCENIWRSQIVFIEGILDFYLHEISKYSLYQMFLGNWAKTSGYEKLQIPMAQVEKAIHETESKQWFFSFLNSRFSRDVFLSEEMMREQLNLIGLDFSTVMIKAFPITDPTIKDKQNESIALGKKFIKELFQRRNAIVHQADRSHESANKNNINKQYVEECIANVVQIVNEIHKIAVEKDSL